MERAMHRTLARIEFMGVLTHGVSGMSEPDTSHNMSVPTRNDGVSIGTLFTRGAAQAPTQTTRLPGVFPTRADEIFTRPFHLAPRAGMRGCHFPQSRLAPICGNANAFHE